MTSSLMFRLFALIYLLYAWRNYPVDMDAHISVVHKHLEMVQAITCHRLQTLAHCLCLDAFYNVCHSTLSSRAMNWIFHMLCNLVVD